MYYTVLSEECQEANDEFPDSSGERTYNGSRKKGGTFVFLDGLDQLDQQILRLLIQNARMSYSEIGQQVGISRVAVKMRVQALEKKGIIEEYTTIINPQRISGAISCYFEPWPRPRRLSGKTRRSPRSTG